MWIIYWTSKENIKKRMKDKDISMIIKIKIVTVMLFPICVKTLTLRKTDKKDKTPLNYKHGEG